VQRRKPGYRHHEFRRLAYRLPAKQ
jgi:hypothetical protein